MAKGKPSKGTPADKRLKENKASAKGKAPVSTMSFGGKKAPTFGSAPSKPAGAAGRLMPKIGNMKK